ncbi:hypothetical protein AAHE18_18G185900 [Arachis hypogaea]
MAIESNRLQKRGPKITNSSFTHTISGSILLSPSQSSLPPFVEASHCLAVACAPLQFVSLQPFSGRGAFPFSVPWCLSAIQSCNVQPFRHRPVSSPLSLHLPVSLEFIKQTKIEPWIQRTCFIKAFDSSLSAAVAVAASCIFPLLWCC